MLYLCKQCTIQLLYTNKQNEKRRVAGELRLDLPFFSISFMSLIIVCGIGWFGLVNSDKDVPNSCGKKINNALKKYKHSTIFY